MTAPITIPYFSLLSNDFSSLRPKFLEAFGSSSSLGLLVISDLPSEFAALRKTCLDRACIFAEKPEAVREKCVHEKSRYSFGWSLGKELFDGKPDLAKGSYYAHPTLDERQGDEQKYPEYFSPNVWPSEEDCPGYREAFMKLASFVQDVGVKLARAMDEVIKEYLPENQNISVADMIAQSQTSKARLLHYFPLEGQTISVDPEAPSDPAPSSTTDDLCAWHIDHSLLTGLVPAQYLFHPSNSSDFHPIPCPAASAGLFIRPRSGGEVIRAAIPSDCMAFQTGEALQVLSKSRLQATPHCVQAGNVGGLASEAVRAALPKSVKGRGYVSRETMAVFLQPNVDVQLDETQTFGQFSDAAFAKHY